MRLLFALAAFAITTSASAVTISGLANTGAGYALGTNGIDNNWLLGAESPAYVSGTNGVFPVQTNWIADTDVSRWITPTANAGADLDPVANGLYFYKLGFSLTGFNAATAVFTGQFAADNAVTAITLNGTSLGNTGGGFTSWTDFSSAGGTFNAGYNELVFTVTNIGQATGNPSGLRVEFLSSNADATGAVPEPATWATLVTGFALVGAAARRRRPATITA